MSGSRAGGSGSSAIPSNAKKVVQDLKEIVKNTTDEEIYAMLKECNMDPNETVQRLISQGTFHEVKRKRDKKKENANNKDSGESRSRSSIGPSVRGGRGPDRGAGRGNYIPRYNSGEVSGGGRGQSLSVRENGSYPMYRASSTASSSSSQLQVQTRASSSGTSNVVGPPGMSNGSSPYTRAAQGARGNWTPVSGHTTMADVVKSSNATQVSAAPAVVSSLPTTDPPSSSDVSTGGYSLPVDPALHSFLVSSSPVGSMKQDVATVESQRAVADQAPNLSDEVGSTPSSPSQSLQISPATTGVMDNSTSVTDGKSCRPVSPLSVSESVPQKSPVSPPHVSRPLTGDAGSSPEAQLRPSSSSGPQGSLGTRAVLVGNHYNARSLYQAQQQQPVGTQRASGLEWKPKPPAPSAVSSQASSEKSSPSEAVRSSPPASPHENIEMMSVATSKLQALSVQDDQPVIIPNHLQVPEAEQTGLSFGSFSANFGSTFSTSFGSDDNHKSLNAVEETTTVEALSEQPSVSSLTDSIPVSISQSYSLQSTSTPVETLASINDVTVSMPAAIVSQPEISKPEPITQQSPQYPYLPSIPSYHGFGLVPQIVGGQYSYEPAESQPQEVSRLPSFVQPFSDPATNYYSPVFRQSSDGDVRYPQFVSTNAAAKYNGSVTLMTGQSLPSSQESGNSMVLSSGGPAGQLSQTAGVAQTTLTMAQQPLPIHAYPAQPAGVPISPFATNIFGYQYVPPSYTYMHTPYQHNYTGNTGYPQPPAGSSYAPAASGTYPPAGAATVKYPLPQYKPGTGAGNAPHAAVAAGYGSYATAPSGFAAVNPAVTAGSASGYDDMAGPQYKESNLYIPSQQQAEGSAVWIQAQLSRDVSGMPTNSYYNLQGQGQHAGYAHTQPTHAHPGTTYTGLYHPSQSAPGPSAHQLLQQPQALGTVGAGGSQGGAYQQPQRGQLNWTNGY